MSIKNVKEEQLVLSSHHSALSAISSVMEQVREELDEHREGLNENVNEVQALYEYVRQVEAKLDRAISKFDELSVLVKGKTDGQRWVFTALNQKEKEVFLVLYSQTESQPFTSYKLIARRLGMSESLVGSYITVLIEKGIPVIKKYQDGCVFLQLDADFRSCQAKDNIVGINTLLTYWS